MKIVKETSRKVVKMDGYRAVCHGCQTPIEYEGELIVIEIERTEDKFIAVPIDFLACPVCSITLAMIAVYYSVDISKELAQLKEKE